MADPRTRLPVKLVDPTTASQEAGVDAAGNLQVILGANDGVDVGDVDVTSIIPGVGVTNLGKAEDQAAAAGDVGIAVMALRDDVLSAVPVDADLDYTNLRVDVNGALWSILSGSLPTGTNEIGDIRAITTSVTPGAGATFLGKAENVPSAGADVGVASMTVQDDTLSALGSADGDYTFLRVNSQGALHVTGGGGGTEFNVDDPLGATPAGSVSLAKVDAVLSALTPVDDDAESLRVDANGALWVIDVGIDAALAGSELQVDIVAPLPTGTNEIGDIRAITTSVTPGTAAANLGKAESAAHTTGDVGVAMWAVREDTPVGLAADGQYIPFTTDAVGRLHVTDPNAGAGTPGTPVNVEANSTDTAPDGTFDVDSADFGAATKRVSWASAASSVNFKAELISVDNDVDTVFATMFGQGPGTVYFRPGHPDHWATTWAGSAGFDGFTVRITNLDTSESADLYGTINHQD